MVNQEQLDLVKMTLGHSAADLSPLGSGEALIFQGNAKLWASTNRNEPCAEESLVTVHDEVFPDWIGELANDRDSGEYSRIVFKSDSSIPPLQF